MSKTCQVKKFGPLPDVGRPGFRPVKNLVFSSVICGRPAMTTYKGQFVCWGCREELEARDAARTDTSGG